MIKANLRFRNHYFGREASAGKKRQGQGFYVPHCHRLMPLRLVIIFVIFTATVSEVAAAAPPSSARMQFERALTHYRNNQLDKALAELNRLVATTRGNSHLTCGYLLLSAVAEKMGDSKSAEKYLQLLLRNFPYSRYVDHAHFSLARMAYKNGDGGETLHHLLCIIERNKNAKLTSLSETIGCKVVAAGIESMALEKLFPLHPSVPSQQWLMFWMIRNRLGSGHRAEAEALAQKFLAEKPEPRFVRLTQELLNRPAAELIYPVRIGIIIPLSGYLAEEGNEFLRGMLFALHRQPVKIALFIKDSQSSLNQAVKSMQELARKNMTLFIGEMDGNTSAALAALADRIDRPLLVPLATDNGIASLGENVFQMNSDLETRGTALAQYAFETLKLRTFATLSPADEYGQAVTDAFTKTIDALGGVIIAQQWYYSGTEDFKRQFAAIRQSAMHYSPRDSMAVAMHLDSLQQTIATETPEVNYSYKPSRALVEDFEVPIQSIDGIFFPIYSGEETLIAPQFALANIKALPLGGEGWYDVTALRAQRRYIDGLVFFAGKYVSDISMDYIQFKNTYRTETNTSPGAMAIYGYDLMQLLISAVQGGNVSGQDIATYLKNMKLFMGLGGAYAFTSTHRVNQSVNILQFRDGLLNKVAP